MARLIVPLRILLLPLTALETTDNEESQDQALALHTWVTRFEAKMFARQAVPDGKVKSVALAEKKGVWVWLLDLTRPHTKTLTEVQIDALSGKVIAQASAPAPVAKGPQASGAGKAATP